MERVSKLEMEEEDTIELSLGLAIGGGIRSTGKRPSSSYAEVDGADGKDPRWVASDGGDLDLLDAKGRRELQALRRQEARKKLEGKQQKKRSCTGNGILVNTQFPTRVGPVEDRTARQESQSNSSVCSSPPLAAMPTPMQMQMQLQYPFQRPLHYIPLPNGYQYPYMIPCWAPAAPTAPATTGEGSNQERNVNQPNAKQSFRPFRRNSNRSLKRCDSEHKEGSTGSSSPAISDNHSASIQGENSSDKSHSSHSPSEQNQPHLSPLHKPQGLTEHSASLHRIESAQGTEEAAAGEDKQQVLKTAESGSKKTQQPAPINGTSPHPPNHVGVGVGVEGDGDKKPKPFLPASLPQMPYVSTTGNGPNGKTVTGLLYRYTKTEVNIVCVCHGSSFSPEGFVKHAGGTDTSHPLRHIVIVPSSIE